MLKNQILSDDVILTPLLAVLPLLCFHKENRGDEARKQGGRIISTFFLFFLFLTFLGSTLFAYSGFHQSAGVTCGQCHFQSKGAYSIGVSTGNVNLCQGCHSGSGSASTYTLNTTADQANIVVSDTGTTVSGTSHAFDKPITYEGVASTPMGSIKGKVMQGKLVCSTCHNNFTKDVIRDSTLREENMCKDCHKTRAESATQGADVYTGQNIDHPVQDASSSSSEDAVNCGTCHNLHRFEE